MKNFSKVILSFLLGLSLAFSSNYILAWTEPTQNPPAGGVSNISVSGNVTAGGQFQSSNPVYYLDLENAGISLNTAGNIITNGDISNYVISSTAKIVSNNICIGGDAPANCKSAWPAGVPANTITGTGSINKISKFTGANTIGDSIIGDNGAIVDIGGSLTTTGSITPAVSTASGHAATRAYVDSQVGGIVIPNVGSGTANQIPKFTGTGTTIGDSLISETGSTVAIGGSLITTNNVGIGNTNPLSKISIGGDGVATTSISVINNDFDGIGIYSENTRAQDTDSYGGYFKVSNSNRGKAVYGEASGLGSGRNYGGYFKATSYQGEGVHGEATASIGTDAVSNYGGYFKSAGLNGVGVHGEATSIDATSYHYGGYFKAAGYFGVGAYGRTDGVAGKSIYGYASGSNGTGILGEAVGVNGIGVEGIGSDRGVLGINNAVYGVGVEGSVQGDNSMAVLGWTNNNGASIKNWGGYFISDGGLGTGVQARAEGSYGTGVEAIATGVNGTGLYAEGTGANAFAGKFKGDVAMIGDVGIGINPDQNYNLTVDGTMKVNDIFVNDIQGGVWLSTLFSVVPPPTFTNTGSYLGNRTADEAGWPLHIASDCTGSGGIVADVDTVNNVEIDPAVGGDNNPRICKFSSNKCPTEWKQFFKWSSTSPNPCAGSGPGACGPTPCWTGSHPLFKSLAKETCKYVDVNSWSIADGSITKCSTSTYTCNAITNAIGCY